MIIVDTRVSLILPGYMYAILGSYFSYTYSCHVHRILHLSNKHYFLWDFNFTFLKVTNWSTITRLQCIYPYTDMFQV